MKSPNPFQTRHLVGRVPSDADIAVYDRVYGSLGARELQRNLQDQARHFVAPWTLQIGGRDVGVGGFRLGFGADEGIELTLTLVPNVPQVGLAGEFLTDAILFVEGTLRADRVFAYTDSETTLSARMLSDAGFHDAGAAPIPGRPDRRIMRWTSASRKPA
jgi:hypothetical protein